MVLRENFLTCQSGTLTFIVFWLFWCFWYYRRLINCFLQSRKVLWEKGRWQKVCWNLTLLHALMTPQWKAADTHEGGKKVWRKLTHSHSGLSRNHWLVLWHTIVIPTWRGCATRTGLRTFFSMTRLIPSLSNARFAWLVFVYTTSLSSMGRL